MRNLTGCRSLQIEYIWVSIHFPRIIAYSDIAVKQALDMGVHNVCFRVYLVHLQDAMLGLISRLVMAGCVLSCTSMLAVIYIN